MSEITVVGSGVIGMTTALCLAKAGYAITVISKDKPSQTTSAAAAALWYPYKAEPQEKVLAWAQKSLSVFKELANIAETGIVWHEFSELSLPETDLPWWRTYIDSFNYDETPIELPAGKRRVCRFNAPIIDTSLYLQFLEKSLKTLGVKFINKELSTIDEAFAISSTVVNCSGIGAIKLVNDKDLHPARGQIVRIKRQANHSALVDLSQEPKLAHITPRINDTVIGGTYEEGVFDLEPDKNETKAIIERCRSIFPALAEISEADILSTACGLRPVRSSVRIESEKFGNNWLFHNYGHGGSGYTLSWGCAEDVCANIIELCPVA